MTYRKHSSTFLQRWIIAEISPQVDLDGLSCIESHLQPGDVHWLREQLLGHC